jgi:hypothetical protein
LPFGAFPITNPSPINPQNPFNLRGNYGNADYDTRNYLSLSYVWDTPKFHGLVGTLANWTVLWHNLRAQWTALHGLRYCCYVCRTSPNVHVQRLCIMQSTYGGVHTSRCAEWL